MRALKMGAVSKANLGTSSFRKQCPLYKESWGFGGIVLPLSFTFSIVVEYLLWIGPFLCDVKKGKHTIKLIFTLYNFGKAFL